ncbi:MAG TPA: thiamine pyrophosphate-dependent enzyme, partial [bacterium]|nr:thiamine pyrophosphate-dependent enzyme [bacterium]
MKERRKGTAASTAAVSASLTADDLRALYRYMLLQRLAEDRIVKLYQQGAVVGACFTGYGHEAIAVGAAFALGPQDVASTLHRDLGARLVLGMPIGYYFANFLGRTGSPTRGREGNLHIGGLGPRILLHIDHIGASIPVAAG